VTDLLQFTIELKSPVNLSALCGSYAKTAYCLLELICTFLYAGNSVEYVSERFVSCIHLSFVHYSVNPTPQTKI